MFRYTHALWFLGLYIYIRQIPSAHVISKIYHIAGFCHEDFNVASHGIRNIKIRYILML